MSYSKLIRLKLLKKILTERSNQKCVHTATSHNNHVFSGFRTVSPHQLNVNNPWHKILLKQSELVKKNGASKLEVRDHCIHTALIILWISLYRMHTRNVWILC